MSIYRVVVREEAIKSKEYEADSMQDAREMAEEDTWLDYQEETASTEILEVIYVE